MDAAKDSRLQDDDPKHRSGATKNLFSSMHIHMLEWASQSPHLNTIANLWQGLKTAVHVCSPSNLTELQVFYKEK